MSRLAALPVLSNNLKGTPGGNDALFRRFDLTDSKPQGKLRLVIVFPPYVGRTARAREDGAPIPGQPEHLTNRPLENDHAVPWMDHNACLIRHFLSEVARGVACPSMGLALTGQTNA